jgi:phage/plasmid-like protein (TIGR03299 family)
MAHEVETLMYTREKPWHGLGTRVDEAPNSAEALKLAGLDWQIVQHDVSTDGNIIPGYKANVRSTDQRCMGIVSSRYKVVQNEDAFAFTDGLIGGDVRYETAGSLCGGRKVFLLARLPETKICGDATEPYLCFTNTHDGTGAVRCLMTPVRVVCNNTLNLALSTARRAWATRHIGDIAQKMHEAQMCLDLAGTYMEKLGIEADRMANQKVAENQLYPFLNELFPTKEGSTEREIRNVEKLKDEFMVCYFAPDLARFRGTAWAVVNAAADMAAHIAPHRNTANDRENNMDRIITGHWIVDRMVELLAGKKGKE